jgi:8-oxo-dGTP pyrophosphatase MutT (NUDIX family)
MLATKSRKITVVRAALTNEGHLIPALLRAKGKNPATSGLWELPGGQVEPGETLDEALEREMWQELGVRVERQSEFKVYEDRVITDDPYATRYQALGCIAVVVGGECQLSDEHVAMNYFLPEIMAVSPIFRPDTAPAIGKLFVGALVQ